MDKEQTNSDSKNKISKQFEDQIDDLNFSQEDNEKIRSLIADFAQKIREEQRTAVEEKDKVAKAETLPLQVYPSSIRALSDKYRIIASSITDIFFMLDQQLNFTFVTPSIEQVLDYTYSELIGRQFDILIPSWSGNTLKNKLESVFQFKNEIIEPRKFTFQLSGKYGSLSWYEVQITGIYNQYSELQGFNGICRDITERLKYEEALKQAKQKAEESDMLKSAFLANMSHEIRTPLNGIIGFATMLNNKDLPSEKKVKYSEYIVSSSKQLLTLINDIIDISKIEAGQLDIYSNKVDLNKLYKELFTVVDLERQRMENNDVRLIMNIPKLKGILIDTDEVRLKQVLFNLLINALKFTNSGKIEFGYMPETSGTIRLYVKDTGFGVPKEIQRAVFERFRQGNIDRQAKISGTGLGLAISKGIVELLGGTIGLISEENSGSEFYFTLPLKNH